MDAKVLRSVSRSFYLSIRFLPAEIREPIALAYLLARATDTVADAARICRTLRIETLELLSDTIRGTASRDAVSRVTAPFVSLQENASERKLLESLPEYLACLEELEQSDRNAVRTVLQKITRGQMLDLQRFDKSQHIRALDSAADLDEYTYLVAGCVGEFWTRLCFRHVSHFASRTEDEMLSLGKQYGMALQLINVLRDAGTDLRAGRCYFPASELTAVDLAPSRILSEPERFQPIYRAWLEKARAGLTSGIEYSRAIRSRRLRAATVLPALIGARTVSLLETSWPAALQRTVKVPRWQVRTIIFSLGVTLVSCRRIDAIFARP